MSGFSSVHPIVLAFNSNDSEKHVSCDSDLAIISRTEHHRLMCCFIGNIPAYVIVL
ncbi:hypothetical protein PILCRDRAFT_816606 [Piloderma croceum F 1598]|uniref:Uncharacterized protein n=1 Tax=Piloderma croceum (strain F 1598) TaxID=765440 RepID=A0A0C3BIC1_PILCF|nr:hypothetical protein PILCRDRAFT_816606 [Piloderma croceum F 1598]